VKAVGIVSGVVSLYLANNDGDDHEEGQREGGEGIYHYYLRAVARSAFRFLVECLSLVDGLFYYFLMVGYLWLQLCVKPPPSPPRRGGATQSISSSCSSSFFWLKKKSILYKGCNAMCGLLALGYLMEPYVFRKYFYLGGSDFKGYMAVSLLGVISNVSFCVAVLLPCNRKELQS
jgi:hypothetical protein